MRILKANCSDNLMNIGNIRNRVQIGMYYIYIYIYIYILIFFFFDMIAEVLQNTSAISCRIWVMYNILNYLDVNRY